MAREIGCHENNFLYACKFKSNSAEANQTLPSAKIRGTVADDCICRSVQEVLFLCLISRLRRFATRGIRNSFDRAADDTLSLDNREPSRALNISNKDLICSNKCEQFSAILVDLLRITWSSVLEAQMTRLPCFKPPLS